MDRRAPVISFGDTGHVLTSDCSNIRVTGAGADAADYALIGESREHRYYVTLWHGSHSTWQRCVRNPPERYVVYQPKTGYEVMIER